MANDDMAGGRGGQSLDPFLREQASRINGAARQLGVDFSSEPVASSAQAASEAQARADEEKTARTAAETAAAAAATTAEELKQAIAVLTQENEKGDARASKEKEKSAKAKEGISDDASAVFRN